MPFDPKTYRNDVLKPLEMNAAQRRLLEAAVRGVGDAKDKDKDAIAGALSAIDLPALFAVQDGMDQAALSAHLNSVEAFLNKGMPPVSKTVGELLRVLKRKGVDYTARQFWEDATRHAREAAKAQIQDFAQALKQERQVLGVVTPAELRKAATAHGILSAVTDNDLASVASANGVQVCPEFEVPSVLLGPPLKKDLDPSFRSIVDVILLHRRNSGRPEEIEVLDSLSYGLGSSKTTITLKDVSDSKIAADQRADDSTESAKKTLNTLVLQCPSNPDLQGLCAAWFADLANTLLKNQGLMLTSALAELRSKGLADLDSRRLLAHATASKSGPGLSDVTDKLAAGALDEADRLLSSLLQGQGATSDQQKAVEALVVAAKTRKRDSIDRYLAAMTAQDYEAARQALVEAQVVDKEDPQLASWLEQLPPPTPLNLHASVDTSGRVDLSWRGAPDGGAVYTVVRSAGAVPVNPKDGTQLVGGTKEERFCDKTPLVATPVIYAVFAHGQGNQYSLPATIRTVVLPPPSEIAVVPSESRIALSWAVHSRAMGVTITQTSPDGSKRSFGPTTSTQLVVDQVKLGTKYAFGLTAHYVLSDGIPAISAPVTTSGTPRGSLRAVHDLTVQGTTMPDGRPGMLAAWTEIPGYSVELCSLPLDEVRIEAGSRVTMAALPDMDGVRITGVQTLNGSHQELRFYQLRDVRVLVPITIDDHEGLAGSCVVAGSAPSAKNLDAVRFGDELVLSWHWPHGDYAMEVIWKSPAGQGQLRVVRASYNQDGGVHIPNARSVTEVGVSTVAVAGSAEYVSTPVVLRFDAVCPSVMYELRLPRGPFGGRQARVTARSEAFRGPLGLIAVLVAGPAMPAVPEDGQTIGRVNLDFGQAGRAEGTFTIPKVKPPYWVRLFPERKGVITLHDPPVATLRG